MGESMGRGGGGRGAGGSVGEEEPATLVPSSNLNSGRKL